MQSFKEINVDDTIYDSRTTINDSIKTVMSNNSGTAFPTTNLQVGMKCYRTDLGKTYTLTDVAHKTWVEDNHALAIATDFSTINGKPTTEDRTSCVVIRDNINSAYRQAIAIQSERPANNNIARIVADAGNNCIRFNLYNPAHDTDVPPYLNGSEFRFNRDGSIGFTDHEGDGTNNYVLGAREISQQLGTTGYVKYAGGLIVQWIHQTVKIEKGNGLYDLALLLPMTIKTVLNTQTTAADNSQGTIWGVTGQETYSSDGSADNINYIQVILMADSAPDVDVTLKISCLVIGLWK